MTEGNTYSTTSSESRGIEDHARDLVSHLATGDYQYVVESFAPVYTDEYTAFLPESYEPYLKLEPESILEESWRALTSLYGPFESIAKVEAEASDEETIVELLLDCRHAQQELRIDFDDEQRITCFEFPSEYSSPKYVDQTEFDEREVTIQTGGFELEGTVSVPTGSDEPPGVVLVHGSGANNRDYAAGPNAILKDLAWGLASRGVTVLRYDKRTFATEFEPDGSDHIDSVVVDDAVAAVNQLIESGDVDPDRVFVVGHSLGGFCAPIIADRHGGLAGIVNLDGPLNQPLVEELTEGVTERWRFSDELSEYGQQQIDFIESERTRIEQDDFSDDETVFGQPGSLWRSTIEYEQNRSQLLQELDCPIFYSRTGRDYPEMARRSVDAVPDGLLTGDSQVVLYNDLNHYYQKGEIVPSSLLEVILFRKATSDLVVDDIVTWIDKLS